MNKIHVSALLLTVLLTACGPSTREYVHVGPNWAALDAIQASEKTFDVDVKTEDAAALGEELTFDLKSEQPGQLWILQVDPNDQTSMLYPNAAETDNRIAADRWYTIPAPGSDWSLEAMRPIGVSVLAFIVTSPGTDLADVFNGQPDEMDKALRLVEHSNAWGLAKKVIDITED